MSLDKIIYCDWELIREFPELYIQDGSVISIVERDYELMMFLRKTDDRYEARVYKQSAENRYKPDLFDEVVSYVENDKFVSFYFYDFDSARRFMNYLPYSHKEFRQRPVRKVNSENCMKYNEELSNIVCM